MDEGEPTRIPTVYHHANLDWPATILSYPDGQLDLEMAWPECPRDGPAKVHATADEPFGLRCSRCGAGSIVSGATNIEEAKARVGRYILDDYIKREGGS